MATRSQYRAAGVMDFLTAVAEHYGASVLHYDADFDHIAVFTGQSVDWVAPKGSVQQEYARSAGFGVIPGGGRYEL